MKKTGIQKSEPVEVTYSSDIRQAVTFSSRFNAREAIAELDHCDVGVTRHHRIETLSNGKFILCRFATNDYLSSNVRNRYCSQLNDFIYKPKA